MARTPSTTASHTSLCDRPCILNRYFCLGPCLTLLCDDNQAGTIDLYICDRMRPPKLPRISTSIDNATMERSPTSAHSRNSSVASNASNIAPLTSNSSLRSHQRWPSSSSSLSSSLNSPINGKLSLADLVEEPAEIEEDGFLSEPAPAHEDYCICESNLVCASCSRSTNPFQAISCFASISRIALRSSPHLHLRLLSGYQAMIYWALWSLCKLLRDRDRARCLLAT